VGTPKNCSDLIGEIASAGLRPVSLGNEVGEETSSVLR
jgi:hypothetical protein